MTTRRCTRWTALLLCAAVAAGCGAKELPDDTPEANTAAQAPQTPPEDADWRTYHGDTSLSGFSNARLPDTLEMRWRYRADEKIYNPPVSDGERWYVATFHGRVIALDLEGNALWSTQIMAGEGPDGQPRKATLDAPPACFGDAVYVATARGVLHAIETSSGAERWNLETEGTFLGTPNYGTLPGEEGKEALYAMSQDDGSVFGVDPATGTLLWTAIGPERCDGSAAVYGDSIVFGSCAAALHIVSAGDGEHVRDIPIDEDSQVAGGVAIVDGSVYSGTRSGKFLHAELKTGLIRWTNLDSKDEIFSTPAVAGDVVVFTSRDGAAYSLDRATGKQKWKYETEGEPQSPIIVDGKVVFTSGGTLYLLRLDTGEMLWSRKVSDKLSSPAVLNNLLVVASEDGAVTAFGPPPTAKE